MSCTSSKSSSISLSNDDKYISDFTTDTEDQGLSDEDAEPQSLYRMGGYSEVFIGNTYNHKYIVEKKIGFGNFSTVWLASNLHHTPENTHNEPPFVVLKFQRSCYSFLKAARDEIKCSHIIQDKIKSSNDDTNLDSLHIIKLLDHFKIHGKHGTHYVLVYEFMGQTLENYHSKLDYEPLPINLVKNITRQLLTSLQFLHEQCNIVHCDLKPENILIPTSALPNVNKLRLDNLNTRLTNHTNKLQSTHNNKRKIEYRNTINSMKQRINTLENIINSDTNNTGEIDDHSLLDLTNIKLADFGNAYINLRVRDYYLYCFDYRAPEILVRSNYNEKIDIWALGCIVYELLTGETLFNHRTIRFIDQCYNSDSESSSDSNSSNNTQSDYPYDTDAIDGAVAKLKTQYCILGDFPSAITKDGRDSKQIFGRKGTFKKNRIILNQMSLHDILMKKFEFNHDAVSGISDFLLYTLNYDYKIRPSATDLLKHPWLQ